MFLPEPNRYETNYEYFSTGLCLGINADGMTCDVVRTEGIKLTNVPVMGLYGAGGQSNNSMRKGDLKDCYVALVNIQGICCVLGTLPDFSGISSKNASVPNPSELPQEN